MARNWPELTGCERIFEVDNVTLEGLEELKAYLEEDIPVRSLDEARVRRFGPFAALTVSGNFSIIEENTKNGGSP